MSRLHGEVACLWRFEVLRKVHAPLVAASQLLLQQEPASSKQSSSSAFNWKAKPCLRCITPEASAVTALMNT